MLSKTKQAGTVGELMVYADLIQRGYDVFTAVGDCCKADAIITRHGSSDFKRVQVKTVQDSSRGVVIATRTKVISRKRVLYEPTDFDVLALAVIDRKRIAYVPMSDLLDRSGISLRLEPPKNGQVKGITFFEDYEDFTWRDSRGCQQRERMYPGESLEPRATCLGNRRSWVEVILFALLT